MRPAETIASLASFEGRGAGTDAERRAARWLATQLSSSQRDVRLEPFWCRPNWALAHAWHSVLGLAGSLVAVSEPRVGGALVLVALLSLLADGATGISLGRRLTPERASQNVVLEGASGQRVHLIITANYDVGRTGLVYRDRLRSAATWLAGITGRVGPGWLGWLAVALVWLLVVAVLRVDGDKGTTIGVAQLPPTVGLVLALALLLEQGTARFGPGANDNASGVAAAVALAGALNVSPSRRLEVELVLQGAGDGGAIGLRHFLRARRETHRAPNTIVIGIAASGQGSPCWFHSDGTLLPLGYFKQLRRLADGVASDNPHLKARPQRGRGTSPALPARSRRLPAIAVGALDQQGLATRSHQAADTPEQVDAGSVDRVVEFGLLLVDAIDAYLINRPVLAPEREPGESSTPDEAPEGDRATPA
ncbi:MAG: M28 family peptidase [Actinobacteria bacterium]|nr:MAG: M28 family peptidase [Actinomycetota bacterium]